MKKKILQIIFIVLLFTIVIVGKIVKADTTVSIQDSDFNDKTPKGNYIDVFRVYTENNDGTGVGMTREQFLALKWGDDYLNENVYYTAEKENGGTTGNYRRAVCINQNAGNASIQNNLRMFPVAVIDIEGEYVKADGPMTVENMNNKWMHMGERAVKFAQAAEYEGRVSQNTVEGLLNYDPDTETTPGFTWTNFLNTAKDILRTDGVYGNFTVIHDKSKMDAKWRTDFEKVINAENNNESIQSIDSNVKIEGTGVGIEEDGHVSISYDGNNTLIGNYQLSNLNDDASVTKKVTIICEDDSELQATLEKNDDGTYYIKANSKITKNIKTIKLLQQYTGYIAKIIVMQTNFYQNRILIDGQRGIIKCEVNLKIPPQKIDVSLQKYITKVNNNSLTASETELTDRKNTYTISGEKEAGANKIVSKSEENNMKAPNTYKYNNIVTIEAGDEVTYRIHVYNNSNVTAKTVAVRDYLDNATNFEVIKITRDGGTEDLKGQLQNTESKYIKQYTIENLAGGAETYFDVTIKFKNYIANDIITNTAWINSTDPSNETKYRTLDRDYIKMKAYEVSLEKFIHKVNEEAISMQLDFNNDGKINQADIQYMSIYLAQMNIEDKAILQKIQDYGDIDKDGKITQLDATKLQKIANGEEVRQGYAEHNYDNDTSTNNTWKSNHVETVSHNDFVTYTIKVKNDGETNVYIPYITDTLPDEVSEFSVISANKYHANGEQYDIRDINNIVTAELDLTASTEKTKVIKISSTTQSHMLLPKEYILVDVKVRVTASNMSLETYKNTAKITDNKILNKNGVELIDSTPNNNEDSDYYELNYPDVPPPDGPKSNDILLSGMVWLDINVLKDNNETGYDGKYAEDVESRLSGITVKLYRTGKYAKNRAIAETVTNSKGYYFFQDKDISKEVVPELKERFIKGPKVSNTDTKWNGEYFQYYIVFEYDGITYTSTKFGEITAEDYQINSNAKEDNQSGQSSLTTRESFNNKFKTINNSGANGTDGKTTELNYDRYINKTSNGGLIIPQSKHVFNKNTMSMQSSTNLIDLSLGYNKETKKETTYLDQIKYVNQGLRGKNTFDLRLKSSVESINVKINGVSQAYAGDGSDVATIRLSDITPKGTVIRDAANDAGEIIQNSTEKEQKIREDDTNYLNDITVTYKIEVVNESVSPGHATKIIDYYNNNLLTLDGNSSNQIKSVTIDKMKADSQIQYVTYRLTGNAINQLKENGELKVGHIAEIAEYTTYSTQNSPEATRGLIDLDSAPGKAASEKVIIQDDYNKSGVAFEERTGKVIENGLTENKTTVEYYFTGDLNKIMYEDDTRPKVAKFNTTPEERVLTGNVFEDEAIVNPETKIKSGNGVYDDGENKVAGMKVELVEIATNIAPTEINENAGNVALTTNTDENGNYTFSGFLPGNYILRYYYGDNEKTILKHKVTDNINVNSYNGEDYQATNNTGSNGSRKLNETNSYWYLFNENDKASVGYDNEERRKAVSQNVVGYSNEKMELLNKIRNNQADYNNDVKAIADETYMYSNTKVMFVDVEKRQIDGTETRASNVFGAYNISNMNFGISRVPVTTIDLQKHISEFTIKDATGQNVIASAEFKNNKWVTKGSTNVIPNEKFVAEIENNQLQGSKLQITYNITANTAVEKDFNNLGTQNVTITGLIDYIDNNLSYNENLGDNSKYWTIINKSDIRFDEGSGTIDKNSFNTIVSAKNDNPLLKGELSCPITLETTLSSEDTTVKDILNSNLDAYEYINNVEITKLNYENTGNPYKDRIRIPENRGWYTILVGKQYDSATSEPLSIVPPFGENHYIMYFVMGAISLAILAGGIVLIKKYAIRK